MVSTLIVACNLDVTPNHEIAEGLDRAWLQVSKYATNHCPFSQKLSTAQKKKNVLQRIVSQATLHVDFSDSITHLFRHGYDFLIPATLLKCRTALKQAQTEIRQTGKDAVNYRREEQQRCMADLLAAGKPGDANPMCHQMKAKEVKAVYRKIRSVQGTSKQGLTRLLVPEDIDEDPKTCTEWVSVDLPHDIETHLRDRNLKHFRQATGTPQTMPPFLATLTGQLPLEPPNIYPQRRLLATWT
jgi:hypothetical protein